ncbi:MAG: nitroreductase family protein [Synergistaceae bacterium]|nr:nitroreductase family protein [Synergistaceae bacterium]
MEEVRVEYSKRHLEAAKECLASSRISFDREEMDFSLNRSYYAILQALRAVTLLDRFDSNRHKAVISYFNRYYVGTNIFPSGTSRLIDSAFKLKSCADYEDFYLADRKDAQQQITDAEGIISMIEPYLAKRWAEITKEEALPMSAIFTRTSTRQFEPRPVESKYIIKILRAAMAAPSAVNQQPWEFYVTEDPDIISRLSQVSPYSRPAANAPVVIVPCWHTDNLNAPQMVQIDMALATQNILLEAEELGLGAVMLGIAPIEELMNAVAEILKLPENFKAFTIIPVGWPVNKRPQEDRYEPSRIHTL